MQKTQTIIIYDGDCGICTFFMQFAIKKFRSTFEIYPSVPKELSDKYGNELYNIAKQSVIVIDRSTILTKSKAIKHILYDFGYPYKIFAYFLHFKIVAALFDMLYKLIAKNRHKISKLLGFKKCKIKHQSS